MSRPVLPRVVTVGGGHGQSAVLRALATLECDVAAVVGIADDGGCSGALRREMSMPPPGDLRRCLSALAGDRLLAQRFEMRLEDRRSVGNLVLSEAFTRLGSLQAAVDWAAELLHCHGRVIPVAGTPGSLVVYDRVAGAIEGESRIEGRSSSPMVAMTHGPEHASPEAMQAIAHADIVLIGPGSFVTSTLATVTTGKLAEAIVNAGRRVMLHNLAPEKGHTDGFTLDDYVRLLCDHLVIGSGEVDFSLDVLRHGDSHATEDRRGRRVMSSPLSRPETPNVHDIELLAEALAHHLNLEPRPEIPPSSQNPRRYQALESYLAQARAKLGV